MGSIRDGFIAADRARRANRKPLKGSIEWLTSVFIEYLKEAPTNPTHAAKIALERLDPSGKIQESLIE